MNRRNAHRSCHLADVAAGGYPLILGITLGVIPLLSGVVGGQSGGLLRLIFGSLSGSMAYVVPLVVIILTIGLIAILEAMKRR